MLQNMRKAPMTMAATTTAAEIQVAKRPAHDADDANADARCPAHILAFLKHQLGGQSPIHIHAEKSAQQSVLILRYAQQPDEYNSVVASSSSYSLPLLSHAAAPAPAPATKAGGSTIAAAATTTGDENTTTNFQFWREALIQGNHRLVVRCWKGGSRWWNLHRRNGINMNGCCHPSNGLNNRVAVNGNHQQQQHHHHHASAVQELAASEIAGYKIARLLAAESFSNRQRQARHHQHESLNGSVISSSSSLVIPQVLYVDMENCNNSDDDVVDPWAIFEYVGPHNPRFFFTSRSSNIDNNNGSNDNDNTGNINYNIYDDYWTRNMILVRDEFGFSEPHPRWGRVPVDQCLAYATTVLTQLIIPLHDSFQRLYNEATTCTRGNGSPSTRNNHGIIENKRRTEFLESLQDLSGWTSDNDESSHEKRGYTYETMIELYQSAWQEMSSTMDSNSNIDPTNSHDNMNNSNVEDRRLRQTIQLLGQCIGQLQRESETIQLLPPVLVHMDCQPQNLLFARRCRGDGQQQQQQSSSSLHVSSVLDWEEAAFADPRFELLLLGRKVCANQAQADHIWNLYETQRSNNHDNNNIQLGPIDPWLCLETVHSLTTLLLQAMDLAGGGRSPWESKPDLWGKIEREFARLAARGWTFCQQQQDEDAAAVIASIAAT
jgi:thiamine kinase-like enzyme